MTTDFIPLRWLLCVLVALLICSSGVAAALANFSYAAFCVPGNESQEVPGSLGVQAVVDRHGLVFCKFELLLRSSVAGNVSVQLGATSSYSPKLLLSDIEYVANTTRIAVIPASSVTAIKPTVVMAWINVTLSTAGLWRVVPTVALLTDSSSALMLNATVAGTVAEALAVVQPPDTIIAVELLPKNQSIVAPGSVVYVRATTPTVALALNTCTNEVQQLVLASATVFSPGTTSSSSTGSGGVVSTAVTSIGLNGSWTPLPISTRNPLAETVATVWASFSLSCRTPDGTISAMQRSLTNLLAVVAVTPLVVSNQTAVETVLRFSSADDPLAMSTEFLGKPSVRASLASFTVLANLPPVSLPSSLPHDVENPLTTADPPVNITIATPTLRSHDPAVNVSALFLANALQVALMTLVLPGVGSERSALQVSTQSTASSFTQHRGATEYRLLLTRDAAVCAYLQVFVDGSVATWFPSSPVTCRVYKFDKGVGEWVYAVCGSVLGAFLALMVADDVRMALRKALSPTNPGSVSSAGGPSSSRHAPATTIVSGHHHDHPSGDVRATYMRLCAIAAAFHDIASMVSNVCFIAFCLGSTQRHWTMLIVMMVVVLVALVTFAIRVHVTMMVMPSRVDIRSGYHVIEVLSGLDDRQTAAAAAASARPRDPHAASQEAVVVVAPSKRPEPKRRRTRNPPGASMSASSGGGVARLPGANTIARYPLETHFWPVANIVVFLLDSAAEGVEFTAVPRSFWFGVQRWVQDVPALIVACFYTVWFPKETNSASVAQLFVAAVGIAFGYKGVLTVVAVLIVTFFSRCLCRGQASNLELWLRDRTGLHIVSAESKCAVPPLRGGALGSTPLTPLSSSGFHHRAALANSGSSHFPASLSSSTTIPPSHLPPLALKLLHQVAAGAGAACAAGEDAASLCVGVLTPQPPVEKGGASDPFGHDDGDEPLHDVSRIQQHQTGRGGHGGSMSRPQFAIREGGSHGSHLLAFGSAPYHPEAAPLHSGSSVGCGTHYVLPTFRDPYFSDRELDAPTDDDRSDEAADDATMIVHESHVFSEGGEVAAANPHQALRSP